MYSHTSLDAAFTAVPISKEGRTVLMKPVTNGGPTWVLLMGHCKSKKRCQVGFLLFFPCSWFYSPLTLVREEEVEDMLIKICSTQVWRERNYTRGQDYMRLFHHLKTCFEIQHGKKYSHYRHSGATNKERLGKTVQTVQTTALQRKIWSVADYKGNVPWWSHTVMKAEQTEINKYRSPHHL